MSAIDIILVIALGAAFIHGLFKGLTEQIVAIFSIIIGAWASFRFSGWVCGWLGQYIEASEKILHIIGFVVVFIAVVVALRLVGKLIKVTIKFVMLGWLDRLLGGIFSILKAGLILGIVVLLFNTIQTTFGIVSDETLSNSVLYYLYIMGTNIQLV